LLLLLPTIAETPIAKKGNLLTIIRGILIKFNQNKHFAQAFHNYMILTISILINNLDRARNHYICVRQQNFNNLQITNIPVS
jgi:hypothetical protein